MRERAEKREFYMSNRPNLRGKPGSDFIRAAAAEPGTELLVQSCWIGVARLELLVARSRPICGLDCKLGGIALQVVAEYASKTHLRKRGRRRSRRGCRTVASNELSDSSRM